jgi:hypothetical protein
MFGIIFTQTNHKTHKTTKEMLQDFQFIIVTVR